MIVHVADSHARPSPCRGEVRWGPEWGINLCESTIVNLFKIIDVDTSAAAPLGPTPTLPLRGREFPSLTTGAHP